MRKSSGDRFERKQEIVGPCAHAHTSVCLSVNCINVSQSCQVCECLSVMFFLSVMLSASMEDLV